MILSCFYYWLKKILYIVLVYFVNTTKNGSYLPWLYEKNANGSNRLILHGEKCLVPTSQPFWKYIEDIETSGVKTRTRYKKWPTVSNRAFDSYFPNKIKEDTERWDTAPDSEVYVFKPSDQFYVI